VKSWLARNIWPWSEIARVQRLADTAFDARNEWADAYSAQQVQMRGEIQALKAQIASDANGNVKRGARGRFVSAKSSLPTNCEVVGRDKRGLNLVREIDPFAPGGPAK
jgi:hydroxypyruvate isomerase